MFVSRIIIFQISCLVLYAAGCENAPVKLERFSGTICINCNVIPNGAATSSGNQANVPNLLDVLNGNSGLNSNLQSGQGGTANQQSQQGNSIQGYGLNGFLGNGNQNGYGSIGFPTNGINNISSLLAYLQRVPNLQSHLKGLNSGQSQVKTDLQNKLTHGGSSQVENSHSGFSSSSSSHGWPNFNQIPDSASSSSSSSSSQGWPIYNPVPNSASSSSSSSVSTSAAGQSTTGTAQPSASILGLQSGGAAGSSGSVMVPGSASPLVSALVGAPSAMSSIKLSYTPEVKKTVFLKASATKPEAKVSIDPAVKATAHAS